MCLPWNLLDRFPNTIQSEAGHLASVFRRCARPRLTRWLPYIHPIPRRDAREPLQIGRALRRGWQPRPGGRELVDPAGRVVDGHARLLGRLEVLERPRGMWKKAPGPPSQVSPPM